MKTKELTLIAICTSLMAVLSPMSIPLVGGVPISLATFVVMLVAMVLNTKDACITVCLYIILAFIGVPVLSGYRSGASVLFGMTGGYIFGYIPLAIFTSWLKDIKTGNKYLKIALPFLGMIIGTIVLYVMGTMWFMYFTGKDLTSSLYACVIPFIPGDIIKIAIVSIIAPRLVKFIK